MVGLTRPIAARWAAGLRLTLMTALLLACAWAPAWAGGKLVAAVLTSDVSRYRDAHRSFVRTLIEHGYDQNSVEIILQSPNPDPISWANSIRKVVAIGADIIITYGAPISLTAVRETDDIPIVFVDVYGPVETGVTKNMTVTGRNITGVSSKVPLITLIKTALEVKIIRNMGVIYNSREVGSVVQLKELKRIAGQQGFAVLESNISSVAGLDVALDSLLSRVDCIYISECAAGCRGFEKIVHRANERKIPVISQIPDAAEKGALVALTVSPAEQGELAAESAVRVLRGAKTGLIPISTPKKIELTVSLRAARTLGLHIPFQVLSMATKVMK